MSCNAIRNRLNAYADGELTKWQVVRVARHVAQCPGCAAELRQIERIGTQARQWRTASAPADLQARIAAALPSPMPNVLRPMPNTEYQIPNTEHRSRFSFARVFHRSQEEPKMQAQAILVTASRRRAIPLRTLVTLAVAVGIFALTAGNLSMLRRQEAPFRAAAQIQKALQQIKTAQWTRTFTTYQPDGVSKTVYTFAGQMNPPAFVYHTRDGEGATIHSYADDRLETLDGSIHHVFKTAHMPDFMPKRDDLKKFPPPSAAASWSAEIREHIVSMLMFVAPSPMPNQTRSGWVSGRVERDGRNVLEFRRDSTGPRYRVINVLDVDPTTYRVVRTEHQQYDARDRRLEAEIIQDNFRYDEDILDSTFQLP